MNLPNVVVKESPKKRDVKKLLNKYDSKWLVDLHSDVRGYKEKDDLLWIGHIVHGYDKRFYKYFDKFIEENYPEIRHGTYENMVMKPVDSCGVIPENYNPKMVVIELFPWTGKEKSLKFLNNLTGFLYHNDFII